MSVYKEIKRQAWKEFFTKSPQKSLIWIFDVDMDISNPEYLEYFLETNLSGLNGIYTSKTQLFIDFLKDFNYENESRGEGEIWVPILILLSNGWNSTDFVSKLLTHNIYVFQHISKKHLHKIRKLLPDIPLIYSETTVSSLEISGDIPKQNFEIFIYEEMEEEKENNESIVY